jgi:hypothetical protein
LFTNNYSSAAIRCIPVAATASADLGFNVAGSERARIDSSGRLLVGTSTARANYYNGTGSAWLQVEGDTFSKSSISITCNNNAGNFLINRSNGASVNSNTLVSSDNVIGGIVWQGNDGTEFVELATIKAAVDGTPGANDMPGRLVFSTTADGASSPTERMRIESSDSVIFFQNGSSKIKMNSTPSIWSDGRAGIHFGSPASLVAADSSGIPVDNSISLGLGGYRWSVVYAATGTINTSDANQKQDVSGLSQAELQVASAVKQLVKKFRFKDSVDAKGDNARIHVGVIAQEVEQAFADADLDPRRYGMFCEDELEDGSKRLGIRYDELLAFVIAAL